MTISPVPSNTYSSACLMILPNRNYLVSVGSASAVQSEIEPIDKITRYDELDIDFLKIYNKFAEPKETIDKENNKKIKGATQIHEKNNSTATNKNLTEAEEKAVRDLESRDKEVRKHEQAHIAAGGSLVRGGAMFNYTTGPDGKQYAIGGEVNIDISTEETPSKTISKMQQVVAAAMAPKDPSAQDYSVAATAKKNAAEARRQLVEEARSENSNATFGTTSNTSKTTSTRITAQTDKKKFAPIGVKVIEIYKQNQSQDNKSSLVGTLKNNIL